MAIDFLSFRVVLDDVPPSFRSNVKRGRKGKTYNTPKYVRFRNQVQEAAWRAVRARYGDDIEMTDKPIELMVDFYYPLLKNTSKKVQEEMGDEGWIRKATAPDIDNIGKGVLDALEGILYENDAVVTHLTARKQHAKVTKPIIMITMFGLPEVYKK